MDVDVSSPKSTVSLRRNMFYVLYDVDEQPSTGYAAGKAEQPWNWLDARTLAGGRIGWWVWDKNWMGMRSWRACGTPHYPDTLVDSVLVVPHPEALVDVYTFIPEAKHCKRVMYLCETREKYEAWAQQDIDNPRSICQMAHEAWCTREREALAWVRRAALVAATTGLLVASPWLPDWLSGPVRWLWLYATGIGARKGKVKLTAKGEQQVVETVIRANAGVLRFLDNPDGVPEPQTLRPEDSANIKYRYLYYMVGVFAVNMEMQDDDLCIHYHDPYNWFDHGQFNIPSFLPVRLYKWANPVLQWFGSKEHWAYEEDQFCCEDQAMVGAGKEFLTEGTIRIPVAEIRAMASEYNRTHRNSWEDDIDF